LLAAELSRIYVPWAEFAPEYIDLLFALERVESEEEAGGRGGSGGRGEGMANARGCGDGGVLSGESDGEDKGGRVSVIHDCEFGRVLEAGD